MRSLPHKEQVHLSIITNLPSYTSVLLLKRRAKILRKLLLLLIQSDIKTCNGKVACKMLASFVGTIWSTSIVLNDIVSLWCRNMIRDLAQQM